MNLSINNKRANSSRLAALSVLLVVTAATQALGATRTINFVNNTGQNVDDLHLNLANGSTVDFAQTTPFQNERGVDGGTNHNLYGANVAANGTATVRLTSGSNKIKLNSWWWTLGGTAFQDGARVGTVRGDNGGATLSFTGGHAAGDGAVLVSVDGMNRVFNTIPGADPLQSMVMFQSLLTEMVDGDFELIHSLLEPSAEGVTYFGNVLGDETRELRTEILAQDSFQPMTLTPVPEPGTIGLLVLAGLAGLRRSRRNCRVL